MPFRFLVDIFFIRSNAYFAADTAGDVRDSPRKRTVFANQAFVFVFNSRTSIPLVFFSHVSSALSHLQCLNPFHFYACLVKPRSPLLESLVNETSWSRSSRRCSSIIRHPGIARVHPQVFLSLFDLISHWCSHPRRGYWHMPKTITTGVGLTDARLAEQGLLSIKTQSAQFAPIRRSA